MIADLSFRGNARDRITPFSCSRNGRASREPAYSRGSRIGSRTNPERELLSAQRLPGIHHYPSTVDPNSASPIGENPGAQISGIAITLMRARTGAPRCYRAVTGESSF
jgi:hypothetical protein